MFAIGTIGETAREIADPFLGSGTTLIAAEQLNRKCYGVEISPAYCDVIVERWENLTGGNATRAKA
jgi:DNA modification methylase